MFERFFYDSVVIGCIMVSSGFSVPLVYGAAEVIYYKHRFLE